MAKKLNDLTNQELINFLGLEGDSKALNENGVEIDTHMADRIIEKLRDNFRFGDIRGHIQAEYLANISYSSSKCGDNYLFYDHYEKIIKPSDSNAVIKIDNCDSIKIFVSESNWIDFFFDKGDNRVTMVLVP